MPKIGSYISTVVDDTDVTSVGTSFNAGKKHTIDLNQGYDPIGGRFQGRLSGVFLDIGSISSATQVTVKGVAENGMIIIPDTTADIALDVGSTTDGGIAIKVDIDWSDLASGLTLFYKTNAGTITVKAAAVSWRQ